MFQSSCPFIVLFVVSFINSFIDFVVSVDILSAAFNSIN